MCLSLHQSGSFRSVKAVFLWVGVVNNLDLIKTVQEEKCQKKKKDSQSSNLLLTHLKCAALRPFPITITSPCCSLSLIKYNPVGVFQHKLDPWPRADFTLLHPSQRFFFFLRECSFSHIPTSYSSLSLRSRYLKKNLNLVSGPIMWRCLLGSATCCLRTTSARVTRLHNTQEDHWDLREFFFYKQYSASPPLGYKEKDLTRTRLLVHQIF